MDHQQLCEANNLDYTTDDNFTISRKLYKDKFHYYSERNRKIRNKDDIQFLDKIIVPTIYKDVKMTTNKLSHLQATGIDSKSNKQYFYHPKWVDIRDKYKFQKMSSFGRRLPSIRRKVNNQLNDSNPCNQKYVLAGIVKLLDLSGFRIGHNNSNNTFGLTTLKKDHIDLNNEKLIFDFEGKGGHEIKRIIHDDKTLKFIEDLMDIDGERLFQYKYNGQIFDMTAAMTAAQVNQFIAELVSGNDFTAKDFRTWRFSCLFLKAWRCDKDEDATLKKLLKEVSQTTCNTSAVLRTSYIHPKLINYKKENIKLDTIEFKKVNGLRIDESLCLHLIEKNNS